MWNTKHLEAKKWSSRDGPWWRSRGIHLVENGPAVMLINNRHPRATIKRNSPFSNFFFIFTKKYRRIFKQVISTNI